MKQCLHQSLMSRLQRSAQLALNGNHTLEQHRLVLAKGKFEHLHTFRLEQDIVKFQLASCRVGANGDVNFC